MLTTTRACGRPASEMEAPAPHEEPTADRSVRPMALKQRLMAADVVTVMVGITLAFAAKGFFWTTDVGAGKEHVVLALATLPVWIVCFVVAKLYQARCVERPSEELRRIVKASAAATGVLVACSFAFQFKALSRFWVVALFCFVVAAMALERTIARHVFDRMRKQGQICRPVLIIGTDSDAVGLMHAAQRSPHLGYRVVGFVGPEDIGTRGGCSVLGGIEDTTDVLRATGATGVIISLPSVESAVVNRLSRTLTDSGYHVALSSGLTDIDLARFRAQDLGGRTLVYIEPVQRDGWRALAKRVFDVVVSLVALIVLSPLLAVAAFAVWRSSPGGVIFAQERVGKDGRTFSVYKLRTMYQDAEARLAELADRNEADGPLFKMAEDPRVTPVGRWLRKLSIDELPQFANVLRGEMSVVGPRPALPREVAQWPQSAHDRLRVLPGITGMWQVSGRSDTTFDEYTRLDLYYVDNWTLATDARIVCRTFRAVLASRGAR